MASRRHNKTPLTNQQKPVLSPVQQTTDRKESDSEKCTQFYNLNKAKKAIVVISGE